MTVPISWRLVAPIMLLLATLLSVGDPNRIGAQEAATPSSASCDAMATPASDHGEMTSMATEAGTPSADAELDLLYIDMMVPHHSSIVALAQVALPRLNDKRLHMLAQNIIQAQTAEIAELRSYREQWYGSPVSHHLGAEHMMQMMPGMSMPMDQMMAQMEADTQVALFCAAADPDLAFIDLVIPHHQSAIDASKVVIEQAVHPEIQDFAQRVIDAQQREIDELGTIRQELYGSATPEPVGM